MYVKIPKELDQLINAVQHHDGRIFEVNHKGIVIPVSLIIQGRVTRRMMQHNQIKTEIYWPQVKRIIYPLNKRRSRSRLLTIDTLLHEALM